ncbi:hypothetical protein FA95DRAFT_1540157 [Auriscalpium vulgare]|uniref:Uncharacterized protein n=1 Tax=Auriscalpium vulgare TaxID=40419 RepID=A0ACB8RVG2_9AGAM|nr:hypothetical protein FA95DRAFT_1540157 [Auriscalpium vulgare]
MPQSLHDWSLDLSTRWDVLGPFPIHAREQHFLSPSFPLNLSNPVDFTASWPSSYADGGYVAWTTADAEDWGRLQVSFPHIRWSVLRNSQGWAAIQHHSLLRATLTISPPRIPTTATVIPNLLVQLRQGSFFTVVPGADHAPPSDFVPEWYSGNIYAMGVTAHLVRLPVPLSTDLPTTYSIYVSGDYEVRLFGDPRDLGSETPVLDVFVSAHLEYPRQLLVHEPARDVLCDFVEGLAFGDVFGVGLRSLSGWWTLSSVSLSPGLRAAGISVSLREPVAFAPGQTRVVALEWVQTSPFHGNIIPLQLFGSNGATSVTVDVELSIHHRSIWTKGDSTAVKASYLYSDSVPTNFLAMPPEERSGGATSRPPILALHGAGVDILGMPFWEQAIPRQKRSWVIMPTGRTSWGFDWHGPSARDAWGSVGALSAILEHGEWKTWGFPANSKVVIVGHSNGGQGAWYLASRFPDRVIAAVPAAGYIKAQAYIPLIQSRSAHFVDPALQAVLESSFTPDNNDLFLSNVVDTPIMAIHGGNDTNVPTWHTREAVSIVKTWKPDASISYHEDAGQPHWYPSVFRNEAVEEFLGDVLNDDKSPSYTEFTLTVAVPSESGSMHGFRIVHLILPGRLGRLRVSRVDGTVKVKTTNVKVFTVDRGIADMQCLYIDESRFSIYQDKASLMQFVQHLDGWQSARVESTFSVQRSSRLSSVLDSRGAFTIVVPDTGDRELAIAQRLALDLDVFHRLDAEILPESTALRLLDEDQLNNGTLVVISLPHNRFTRRCLTEAMGGTSFRIVDGTQGFALQFRGSKLLDPGQGAIFLHPHPTSALSSALFLVGNDEEGLERLARLFPIRTGVSVPDWLIIGRAADTVGAAGVEGAGIWGENWSYNMAISWHD